MALCFQHSHTFSLGNAFSSWNYHPVNKVCRWIKCVRAGNMQDSVSQGPELKNNGLDDLSNKTPEPDWTHLTQSLWELSAFNHSHTPIWHSIIIITLPNSTSRDKKNKKSKVSQWLAKTGQNILLCVSSFSTFLGFRFKLHLHSCAASASLANQLPHSPHLSSSTWTSSPR